MNRQQLLALLAGELTCLPKGPDKGRLIGEPGRKVYLVLEDVELLC